VDFVQTSIRQPVTIAVGVLLVVLAGLLALRRIPIQLTPNVEDTVVAVTTRWEGASPQEVEQDLIDPQEERLQGITGLKRMTSTSQQGVGSIRLEFDVGTPKDLALREASDKLREVPNYPENVDEPVVEASDPENRDYIAWIVFDCTDDSIDVRQLQDFAEDRIQPALERVPGVAEVNVLGGRERETQVRFDPTRLAQVGVSIDQFASALRRTNDNVSAGALDESNSEVRVRMVSQYESVEQVLETLVAETSTGPVYVRDVADVVETFKEPTGFVRSRGRPVIAINAQREVDANVMEVMQSIRDALARLNADGGLLDAYGRQLGIDGRFTLTKVYDQTIYIDDALALVRSNIWIGGGLAVLVLLLFLRSLRSPAIITLAIPISVVGAIVFMVALGRSVNVISLAGMAFAIGMVVDNAIVVLENIFRHLELGKPPMRAAYDGTREVFGAVVASTLTTVVVFVPILLIEEEAGQLFRDIALAIVGAVTLSLLVSVTVIPCASARILKPIEDKGEPKVGARPSLLARLGRPLRGFPDTVARIVHFLNGSVLLRLGVVLLLTAASLFGTWMLLPPPDYLPVGNRNLVFGLIIPPPGMSIEQQEALGFRVEEGMRPYFEAGRLEPGTPEYERADAALPRVATFDFATMSPGEPVAPPPLENYFLVAFPGSMFHGGIASEAERVTDTLPLFRHATRSDVIPGVLAFAFQVPLFQLGGRSGSAVEINFSGADLDRVTSSARSVFLTMMQAYGPYTLQPDPSNFDLPTPELQILPDLERLSDVGLSPAELGIAVQALGDGAFLGDYVVGSQTTDLKLIGQGSLEEAPLSALGDQPLATPSGRVVPLSALATLQRVNAPGQINRTGRQRSVSLQFTPPTGMPLGEAMASVDGILEQGRASGAIPFDVETSYSGSASKLDAVRDAMLGDRTLAGTLGSSLVLALLVVYLMMCVLFQSFLRPLIILFSVPLATLGGFAGLYGVHIWSLSDRYMPVQNLDVLTMLGFVILIGVVVNNAILIVHQAIQFMKGTGDQGELGEPLAPRQAITEAVRSRVRPIFMSMLTSVLGMSPLIFMPGAGSELYRGLGSVVVGGLLVSTLFTLVLVPLLLSLVSDVQDRFGLLPERAQRDSLDDVDLGTAASGMTGVAARSALGLLVCAALLVSSCASEKRRPAKVENLASEMVRAALERVAPGDVERAPSKDSDESQRVEQVVADRLDQLEELGGPSSYDVEVELGADLAQNPEGTAPLSLDDALERAIESNLGIEVVRLGSEAVSARVEFQEAAFDTVLFSRIEGERADAPTRVPVINGIPVGAPFSSEDRAIAELGVRRLLASGATVSVSGYLERFNNRVAGVDFQPDPAWRTGINVGIVQPLMQGFGDRVTEAALELEKRGAARSQEDLAAEALIVVALTEQAYWDLAEAWSALRVRRALADQGVEVERVLRERLAFDADQAAYSDALASLQRRETELIRARRLVRAASDNLKVLLNAPDLSLESEVVLEPTQAPVKAPLAVGLRESLASALERRPELRRALLEIEDAELREQLAADAKRPRLDLLASVQLLGLGGAIDESTNSLFEEDGLTAVVGLDFEQPIGRRAGLAEEREARLRMRQSLARYEQVVDSILLEVKGSLRDVMTNGRLLDATRATRLAETENLRTILVEEELRSVLTPEFLALKLSRQERLATAQLAEVEALANYNRALAAYRRAVGVGGLQVAEPVSPPP
jgi:HAE1 family hydrophobic/amphiphilic exporter-1